MAKKPTSTNLTPEQEADVKRLMAEASALYDQEKYEVAISLYDQVITIDPKNAKAWASRGTARHRLGQHAEAIVDLDKAIEFDPNNSTAWNNCGLAKSYLELYSEAISDFNKAIELNPKTAPAWSNRGAAKNKLGQYAEAIIDLDNAIKLDPNNAVAWNNRGFAKSELGQHLEAIIDFEKSIELDPNNALAWGNRGTSKSDLGQYTDAVSDLRKALSLDPDSDVIIKNLQAVLQNIELEKLADKNTNTYANQQQQIRDTADKYVQTYIVLYFVIGFLLFALGVFIYSIINYVLTELLSDDCRLDCLITEIRFDAILPITSATLALSLPIVWMIRILTRIAEDAKILSAEYRRLHFIENRVELFFTHDSTKAKRLEMQELLINHMMTQSPVETLLKLKKRNSPNDAHHPAERMLDRCKDLAKSDKAPSG